MEIAIIIATLAVAGIAAYLILRKPKAQPAPHACIWPGGSKAPRGRAERGIPVPRSNASKGAAGDEGDHVGGFS